jgi:hypothetical protein
VVAAATVQTVDIVLTFSIRAMPTLFVIGAFGAIAVWGLITVLRDES